MKPMKGTIAAVQPSAAPKPAKTGHPHANLGQYLHAPKGGGMKGKC